MSGWVLARPGASALRQPTHGHLLIATAQMDHGETGTNIAQHLVK